MNELKERILRGFEAIIEAKSLGKETTEWERHLSQLLNELSARKVKVRAGKFGFCTCSDSSGLCSGCWKIKHRCECIEREVSLEVEMIGQFQSRNKHVN